MLCHGTHFGWRQLRNPRSFGAVNPCAGIFLSLSAKKWDAAERGGEI